MTANLTWIVKQTLEGWITSHISISDSQIAICWTTTKKKRLSIFHRNRTVQIRRAVDLDTLYHVISEANPSDVGTRPSLITEKDVGPDSVWEKGHSWMNGEISDAIENGILTPASKLRVKEEEEEDFNQGVIIEKSAEILTRGHQVSLSVNSRAENVKSRSNFSRYVIEPTKFKFEKVVRILATVWKFIRSFKVVKRRNMDKEVKFQMFANVKVNKISTAKINSITPIITSYDDEKSTTVFTENYLMNVTNDVPCMEKVVDIHRISAVEFGTKVTGRLFRGRFHILLTDMDVSLALEYLFRKGSEEVNNSTNLTL